MRQRSEKIGVLLVQMRQRHARERIVEIEDVAANPIGSFKREIVFARVESQERILQQLIAEPTIKTKSGHLYARSCGFSRRSRAHRRTEAQTEFNGGATRKEKRKRRIFRGSRVIGRKRVRRTARAEKNIAQQYLRIIVRGKRLEDGSAQTFRFGEITAARGGESLIIDLHIIHARRLRACDESRKRDGPTCADQGRSDAGSWLVPRRRGQKRRWPRYGRPAMPRRCTPPSELQEVSPDRRAESLGRNRAHRAAR